MAIEPVREYDPKSLEEEVLTYWRENNVMQDTLRPGEGERFSFLEGPPTANAPPALHHVEVRTFKDIVNRFHYMLGYSVPRKAGWDCHGLPVEVQVERELELDSKKDIELYGVDKFVEKCRDSVFSHIKEWDALTERMGYWVDLEDPYVTMKDEYIESVWWSLKNLWEKGLLYEGHRVVPFCPRCGTPLSSHEVAQGYESVKEETVIVAFRAKDRGYSLLAWTTTPWTLLSNLALAVHPEVTYAIIKHEGERYVLAKELAEKRFPEADFEEEIRGADLVGVEYYPVFSHFIPKLSKPEEDSSAWQGFGAEESKPKKPWRVLAGDFVTTEEGTGIVHIAPAFGEDDYNIGKENSLPIVNPVDLEGRFNEEVPELQGMFVKDADAKIIQWLDEMGVLVARYPYEHDYPFCWRCKTPLLYYAMRSWFVRVDTEKLVHQNSKVSWYPETIGEGRFGNWVKNARDWSLSRNRFWGTPLPIWRCGCGKDVVVGSRAELLEKALTQVPEDIELHRPFVDEVKLKCECGGQMERVEYVLDCWYDSGAATFAQYHYPFENEELFRESFPYDFICEATDQTRGWFYTLLVLASHVFEEPAYMNCVVGGLLLDDEGEKMSKSNQNIVDPWQLFEDVGADAVRLQMCHTAPWNAKRFGTETMNEAVLPLLRTLWNCYSFTVRYMLLDGFDPRENEPVEEELQVEDQWILSAADEMLEGVKKSFSANEYHHAVSKIYDFVVEDLSRWYIKIIRERMWFEDEEGKMNPSKRSAYVTLSAVLGKACIAFAPIAPFISEKIYLNLLKTDVKSIHHMQWPEYLKIDRDLMAEMDVARKVFEAASRCRQEANIKLRYPIAKITVSGGERVKAAAGRLADVIAKQVNCKKVEYVDSLEDVGYEAYPDFSVIGPKYGKDASKAADAIRSNPQAAKAVRESGNPQEIGGFEVSPNMISDIKITVPDEYAAADFSTKTDNGVVLIETQRSKELMNEALARDLIRNVQEVRKRLDLEELARIRVQVSKTAAVEEMLAQFRDTVLEETRADNVETTENLDSPDSFKYEDETINYRVIQ